VNNHPRILHFNLARGWRGGEQQTWLLLKSLHQRGFHQGLCAHKTSPLVSEVAHNLPDVQIFSPAQSIARLSRNMKFDVGHAHDGRSVYLAWLWSLVTRKPYIVTRRMQDAPRSRFIAKKAYCCSSALVGISQAACAGLKRICPGRSVAQIPSAFTPAAESNQIDAAQSLVTKVNPESVLIGHAGALVDSHKGQSVLVEAVSRLRQTGYKVELVLLGDGPDRAHWQQYAQQSPWLHVVGHKAPISRYLGALDIFAFPSRHEGLGSVLLDVMLAEVPIVASDVGGISDIIRDESTGLLVQPNEVNDLVQALERMLRDPVQANVLAKSARLAVEGFSPDAMSNAYQQIYRRADKAHRASCQNSQSL
jgi:glycosyltransferase involved in cell wall biosynthesis